MKNSAPTTLIDKIEVSTTIKFSLYHTPSHHLPGQFSSTR